MSQLDVKKFRKEHALKQGDLAKIAGVSVSAVRSWEQGQRGVSPSALKLIEKYERGKGSINIGHITAGDHNKNGDINIGDCRTHLENAKKEIEFLKQRIRDKEEIIEILKANK